MTIQERLWLKRHMTRKKCAIPKGRIWLWPLGIDDFFVHHKNWPEDNQWKE